MPETDRTVVVPILISIWAKSLVLGSPASVNFHFAVAPETPLKRPVPAPSYVSKRAGGGFGLMAGSSLQAAAMRLSRWNLLPPKFTSRLFGPLVTSQCSSKPCVTRVPLAVNTLPPPVMKPWITVRLRLAGTARSAPIGLPPNPVPATNWMNAPVLRFMRATPPKSPDVKRSPVTRSKAKPSEQGAPVGVKGLQGQIVKASWYVKV